MNETPLEGIRACVFDAYGTLFDYASAAARCSDVLGNRLAELNALWREKQLQYSWLRALQGRHAEFWQVTGDALDFAMATLGLTGSALRERLMNLYLTLDAFPEVPETLQRLKTAGLKTAVLSNGTTDMLQSAIANAGIGDLIDLVLSVEEVGVYKPHASVYQLAVGRLGVEREAISFQSSNSLGCLRRLGVRLARRLVQSLRPAARASAGQTRPRSKIVGRSARAAWCEVKIAGTP